MRLLTLVGALLFLLIPATASATPPMDVEAARLAVVEAVNVDTANFGGVYLDADGTLVIQYVGANVGRAAVEARLDPTVSVRWQKVDRSRADLDQIAAAIKDRHLDGVVMIEIDTINNQVKVTVDPDRYVAELSQLLGSEYGVAVNVVAGPPAVVMPAYPSPLE